MKRRFRLIRAADFKRVRSNGKSYEHPLVVLYATPAEGAGARVGVTATRAVGNAVRRNRAKRLLRAAMADLLPHTADADLLLVARAPLPAATFSQTRQALASLLRRAGLIPPCDDD